ncbi:hypothetical protein DVH24_023406 [Malus domestica]|uniref:Coiled-coil domain-containing protein 12 n=2 Tax=Malus TaxID=3749 RepID=A0A498I4K9_MALDO|nr:hypothetical protein DVH24_023406 [Malus domestica]
MLSCGRLCLSIPVSTSFFSPPSSEILNSSIPFHSDSVNSALQRRRRRVRGLLFVFSGEAMAVEEDSVEQVLAARQERLRALKAAQELLNTPDEDSAQAHDNTNENNAISDEANANMKFRNYVPHDKQLQGGKLVPPVLPKFEDPVAAVPPLSEKKEDPFVNIAPKKPNWELRRDVQKRLDKLEKRTQKAMLKLMGEQEKQKQLDRDGGNGGED